MALGFQSYQKALMAIAAAAMATGLATGLAREQAFGQLGAYEGRGKGKTTRHNYGGTRAYQRTASKKRNQRKHRLACR